MVTIIVYDCFKQKQIIEIKREAVKFELANKLNIKNYPALRFKVTPIEYYYFCKEITNWNQLINKLLNNTYLVKYLISIRIMPNAIITVDYRWNNITYVTLMEKIETEHLFSWLSTLGGGYSALGDQFHNCSKIAAKISLQQLNLCYRLGDPNLQSRCKLFFSISLIQQGKLKLAKKIIREQYRFAKSQTIEDTRLIKMCQGIFLKLQHSYRSRLLENQNSF